MRITYFESNFQGYSSKDTTTASVIDRYKLREYRAEFDIPAANFLINAAFFPNQQSSAPAYKIHFRYLQLYHYDEA